MKVVGFQPHADGPRLAAVVTALGVMPPGWVGTVVVHDHACTFARDPDDRCCCRPSLVMLDHAPGGDGLGRWWPGAFAPGTPTRTC